MDNTMGDDIRGNRMNKADRVDIKRIEELIAKKQNSLKERAKSFEERGNFHEPWKRLSEEIDYLEDAIRSLEEARNVSNGAERGK